MHALHSFLVYFFFILFLSMAVFYIISEISRSFIQPSTIIPHLVFL